VVLVPDFAARDAAAGAAWASGTASCRCGMRRALPSGCRRAAFIWRSRSAATRPRSCASASLTVPIASSAIVPAKGERAASVEPPPNADARFVRSPRRRCTWRAIGSIRRPRFGARRTRGRGARLAERHRAVYQEWVGEELLAANFPAIHAVGRASARAAPGRAALVAAGPALPAAPHLGRQGRLLRQRRVDIKPGSGMALMKKDMGGAAVALGARAHAHERRRSRRAARADAGGGELHQRQRLPARATCSRRARGLTVEVGNTDAEGRWCLCDALALADAERPDLIIDFATLTGAARVALGPELPALFGNDDEASCSRTRRASPPPNTIRCGRCRCGCRLRR
jgi:hypothetical protein